MHLWRLWIVSGVLAAFAAGAAVIYKWTDADGVVHYSDQAVPGAEKLFISSTPTKGIGKTTGAAAPATPPAKPPGRLDYKVLAVESPTKEEVFFGDDVVPVRLGLEPGLKPDQEIIWNLNGSQLTDQGSDALNFTLPALSRGTYVIGAVIKDTTTGQTQSSESVTFYVRQPSSLAPLNPQHK
jgi:hypothetical protein